MPQNLPFIEKLCELCYQESKEHCCRCIESFHLRNRLRFVQENVVKLGNIHDFKDIGGIMFAESFNDTETHLVNRKYVCQP